LALILAGILAPHLSAAASPASCPPGCDAKTLARQAVEALAANRHADAERLLEAAEKQARAENNPALLVKILNNLAAARMYRKDYRKAFEALEAARTLAESHQWRELEAGIWSNLSSLYSMLAAWPAAEEALVRALSLMPRESRYRPALLAQRLRLVLSRKDTDERTANRLWQEAMEAAEESGDWQVQRHLWDDLAQRRLDAGDTEQAEAALANSFRLVALHRLRDPQSLWMFLARLRLAQGKPEEAERWIRKLVRDRGANESPINALQLATAQLEVEFQRRGPAAALAVCRKAWPEVLRWRNTVLPDSGAERAADVAMTVFADYYASLANGRNRPDLSTEAWAAIEQSRALGLLRMRDRRAGQAPVVSAGAEDGAGGRYRKAVWRTSASGPAATSALGKDNPGSAVPFLGSPPAGMLAAVQARLRPTQTLFCFWLGRKSTAVWAVTRNGFYKALLMPREELAGRLRRFRQEIMAGQRDPAAGSEIYQSLFGVLPEEPLRNPEWLISGDDELLLAPLGALQAVENGQRVYLAEAHSLTLIPSALYLFEDAVQLAPRRLLVVGDLVHNLADPRFAQVAGSQRPSRAFRAGAANQAGGRMPKPELELPTLPGSGKEAETILALWKERGLAGDALTGFDATVENLEQRLRLPLTDLHFATHVLPAPGVEAYSNRVAALWPNPVRVLFPVGEPFLALSLRRDGGRDGLSAAHLANLPGGQYRVVLNGCSTGAGPAQPGAGVHSFATAWLAAGAVSVVASLWQVADDAAFFDSYYRRLLDGARPSAALKAAQTAMIRSGTWRAQPRYWAAYFHLGKD
jgi:CHAT domain-containing protein/tetratricopeptide (TPR) repeat protein